MDQKQKELAQKILDQVGREPHTLYMGAWEDRVDDEAYDWKTDEYVEFCGTTRCVAGWAVHFSAKPGESVRAAVNRIARTELIRWDYEEVGAHLLGLDQATAKRLFFELDEQDAVEFLENLVSGA